MTESGGATGTEAPCPAAVLAADADSNGGEDRAITFTRIIVMPDGQRWVEGVTPKQLPAPASHELPSDSDNPDVSVDIDKESSA
jgi:hypothetical protein